MRPFRFGLSAGRTTDPNELLDMARRTEAAGYSCFYIPDHLGRLATMPSLMAVASATQRINVAPFVLNQDFRPPSILAWDASAMQVLTSGRLELGLGAGWNIPEYTQTGIAYDPPGVRVSRFDEYVQVVKGLLGASEPFSFEGRFFKLKGFQPLPRAASGPPPIFIGGGSQRILGTAGRLADIISVSTRATPEGKVDAPNLTASAVDKKIGWIREAAGARFGDIELNMALRYFEVTHDRAGVARRLLEAWRQPGQVMTNAEALTEDDLLRSPHLAFGTVDEIITQFEAARERWGFSYFQLGGNDFDAAVPVVERLNGR
jgi:probable F420-dependent oxidoreductase